jgi:hypothetical protein
MFPQCCRCRIAAVPPRFGGSWPISNEKSASVYRWGEVAIASAASPESRAERMRYLIADSDAGPKSSSARSNISDSRITNSGMSTKTIR